MTDLTARTLQDSELDDYFDVFRAAFLLDDELRHFRNVLDAGRSHGVFDGDELIGVASRLAPRLALPGGTSSPLAAVTAVGVRPGHRRRGVLTRLMRAQLHSLHEDGGAPVAALYASEGGIYGRFGYAVGTYETKLSVPGRTPFKSTVDIDPRPVRELGREAALEFVHRFYPTVERDHAGRLSRDDTAWEVRVAADRPGDAGEGKPRFAVHPDGYVIYRPEKGWTDRGPDFKLHVQELVAATPRAYAALWRYLLDVDFAGEVRWDKAAIDEPVVHLLANPRTAGRRVVDGLWLRLVDLDRALRARTYSAPLDTVLEVTDAFCPWNAGRWRLRVDDDGNAEVSRTEDAAALDVDITDLASVYLGGNTFAGLARGGRLGDADPDALRRASRAFATDVAPHCQEGF
ncbi:GNAT family N-acetyltransferase [Saccharopolyspora erythraea]|uniref:GNAT family N-acetyltransferase n=1 Tax=Saccharopolyspora erythraea TaxID=1836 RepID=UPI001BA7B774|nr:GNAT family N-acetyltransferase [Saccharopolyspora erythraea]QUH00962.1 GNAT family N-acetyltransferase [Saccharopolyspora erythraea]